jgi:hypothetical protein
MTEQILPKHGESRFAGALFRMRMKTTTVSSFISLLLIFHIGVSFGDFITELLLGEFGRNILEYFFSPRRFFYSVAEFCSIWIIVWLLANLAPQFCRWLLPYNIYAKLAADVISPYDNTFIIEEAFEKETKYSEKEMLLSNRLRTIAAIDERIARLRIRANFMLYAAGLLLVGASLIIVFAGTLTNLDASAVSNVDKVSKDISDSQKRLARLSQIEELKKNSPTDQNAAKKLQSMTDGDSTLPISDNGIQAAIAEEEKRLTSSEELFGKAWQKELDSARGYNDSRYIIATAITRVGVVLVIIFLAQVLINLYRYNTRLITFYNSRRDLLQVWDGKGAGIEKLQKLMVPNVDFGREPKHPLEDIIRQVIAKIHPPAVTVTTGADRESPKN